MCTGLELAALAASTAATAGSAVMQNRAQQKNMKRYNEQVNQQNRLLESQHADRQQKINAAKDEQARTFNEVAGEQDAEFEKQRNLAKEKQKLFKDMATKPLNTADAPEMQDAVDKRNQMYAESARELPASYSAPANATTENRVLRDLGEKSALNEKTRTSGIADAMARMGAMGDVKGKQAALFRDLGVGMNDFADDAASSSRALDYRLRPKEYRMGALGASMGEQANMPYFRGTEPVYKPPNTLLPDLLGGAGQIGMTLSTMRPRTKTATATL